MENNATGDCNLECKQKGFRLQKLKQLASIKLPKFQVEGGKEAHEFIGPVRVVLVTTPKREYRDKTWGAASIVLGLFAVGATVMPIFFYCLSFTLDKMACLHVLLFTAGFQLLTPAAFFTMNTNNGSSSILKPKHRKIDYFLLKVVSLTLIISGLVCSLASATMKFSEHVWSYKNFTWHGGIGALAVFLSIVDLCTFPCLPCNTKRVWPKFALVFCIPSFFLSSICFILGIMRPKFKEWLPLPVINDFMVLFCVFYTLIAISNPLTNLKCGGK